MRIDLHNHTIDYSNATRNVYKTDIETIYTTKISFSELDHIAVTNYHDVKNALLLKEKFGDYIIVGSEYLVVEKMFPIHIVCFPVDERAHKLLMSTRLRGLEYFTKTLQQENIVFFLTRIGWGANLNKETARNVADCLKHFYAIDVANISGDQESIFAKKLASYYGLAPIGGSDTLISQKDVKIFTESPAVSLDEFFENIKKQKTTIGKLFSSEKPHRSSFWEKSKDIYKQHLYQMQWTHLNLDPQRLKKSIHSFLPSLEFVSQAHHLYKLEKHSQQVSKLERVFVDHLKAVNTENILKENLSNSQKKDLWLKSIHKINQCFE